MASPNSSYSLAASPSRQITVIDVYDLAESINRDFEVLVERFGNDSFDSIVRKVLTALETLEALAKHNDSGNSEILDLQKTIERFEQEKQQRTRDKENLERDIIELEDGYKREIDELCKIVKKLQAENKHMKAQIAEAPGQQEAGRAESQDLAEEHLQALMDLRKATHTQKEQIKELQRDLDGYCNEVDTLRGNIERLIQQNKELLRKNKSLQRQGRTLLLERAEIMRRLQQSEESGLQLRHLLNETNRACKDLEQQQQGEGSPRFSLAELREVLAEKNSLKARVMELEERMEMIRASSPAGMSDLFELSSRGDLATPVPSAAAENLSTTQPAGNEQNTAADKKESPEEDNECLVFGPINREPDEKLHPWKYERKNSGVRRFFRMFTSTLSPSGFVRRTSK